MEHTLPRYVGPMHVRGGRLFRRIGMVVRDLGPAPEIRKMRIVVNRDRLKSCNRCDRPDDRRPHEDDSILNGKAGVAMDRFRVADILTIGDVSDRPTDLHEKLGNLISGSTEIRADVESLSTETGEYRVLLRGTLDTEEPGEDAEASLPEALPAIEEF